MRVHRKTIEVLIELHTQCHNVFESEFHTETEGEDAMEAAAMDYMSCPERAKFCCLIDNLENEVCRELIVLMQIGADRKADSSEDFERLKERAYVNPDIGNYLIGEQHLPEQWRAAMEILNIS